uniref:TEP1-F n=1 Tax=Vargula sp. RS-2014 TaxID=1569308 RepID=A0A0E4B909_9CRUS|nr:alpha-2-macroglobulin 3 [Vargula sp. RS-2014]
MKNLNWVILLCCMYLFVQGSHGKRGYIFVAPKQFQRESNETMCILFNNLEEAAANITITLYDDKNETSSTKNFNMTGSSSWHCISDFQVPAIESYGGYLNLRISFPSLPLEHAVDETREATILFSRNHGPTTFLETDKDKYKYGQTVKFRILSLDFDNKPFTDTIPEVWIEDPGLNRVAQWKDVAMKHGLNQLSYTLSSDPPKGHWTIRVKGIHGEKSINFEVAEYVLPKFTLSIKGQRDSNNIYDTDKNYTWTICAKYTHGEDVTGTMDVSFTKRSYSWWRNDQEKDKYVAVYNKTRFSGCKEVTLTKEEYGGDGGDRKHFGLELKASVEEDGTGVTVNDSIDHYHSVNSELVMNENDNHFKPGLFYSGEIQLSDSERIGLGQRKFELCVEYLKKNCANFTSDADGKFRYVIQPVDEHDFNSTRQWLDMKIKLFKENGSVSRRSYSSVQVWHSNAYKFIRFLKQEDGSKLKCNRTYQTDLYYSPPPETVTASIAVMSSGRIVRTTSILLSPTDSKASVPTADHVISLDNQTNIPDVLHQTFPLEIGTDVSEKFNVLVHYTLPDGEIVAAGTTFEVETCLEHEVRLKWSKDKPSPGEDINLQIDAAPLSVCGISVVDRSVKLLSSNNQIKKENLLKRRSWLHTYQYTYPPQQRDWEYCRKKNEAEMEKLESISNKNKRSLFWGPYYGSSADSITAFDIAGLIVMTDLLLETRPCHTVHGPAILRRPVMAEVAPTVEMALDAQPVDAEYYGGGASPGPSQKELTRIRQDFPETWLFDLEYMGDANSIVKQVKVPDTITEWVGSGYCLSSSEGLGISEEASFISFTPFFIDYNLPYSVKRGETFELKVSVFNYLGISAPVLLELQQSNDYDVADGVYNKTVMIPPNKSQVITYLLTATNIGDVNITSFAYLSPVNSSDPTYANISFTSDAIRKTLLVEPEGFPQEEHQVEFMCVQDGAQLSKLLDCSPPPLIVPDSAKTIYSVTGDLMGPLLTNIDSFIQFPTGCGEQNMATFVPNIHALTYLDSMGAAEPELREKSKKHMEEGYQRQLKYKHSDGSYSAFGESSRTEIGSIWLTAFVLKSFSQAAPYTFIDEKVTNQSKEFIYKHQMKDGCFQKVGKVFHRALKGGVGQSNDTRVLTAYIITALLEAGEKPESEPMLRALQCIKEMPDQPYAQALGAYAFLLANGRTQWESSNTTTLLQESSNTTTVLQESSNTTTVLQESSNTTTLLQEDSNPTISLNFQEAGESFLSQLLQTAKKESQLLWWEQEAGCKYCRDSNVEIAAYALMAFLLSDPTGWSNLRPIARYLISQRNTHGAFYSTQDTVVALEALTKYAMQAEQVELKQVAVTCVSCAVTHTVNAENRLITDQTSVGESLTGNIVVQGHGCAIAQCSIKYNIPEAKPSVAFNIKASGWPLDEPARCRYSELLICISYVLDTGESNMAVVEIGMASGYKPELLSLDELQNNLDIDLKRYEVEENKVNLYFDYFDQNQKCFTIRMDQDTVVTNPKPANVKVYDYYQTELTTSTSYSICNDAPIPAPPPPGI